MPNYKQVFRIILVVIVCFSSVVSIFQKDVKSATVATTFSDIKPSHWAYLSVKWAVENNLFKGYPDGTFRPERNLTEAEFITLLLRYDCTINESQLKKSKAWEHWAKAYYDEFKKYYIPLKGYQNNKIKDQTITRGHLAQIIAAHNGYDLSIPYATYYMYKENLSSGMSGKKDFIDYGPEKLLTRAEAATFLMRLSEYGKCGIQGLTTVAKHGDNRSLGTLPINFMKDSYVVFNDPPGYQPYEPDTFVSNVNRPHYSFDIVKPVLNANGYDRTFITLNLDDCQGNSINSDLEATFKVTSEKGAGLDKRFRDNGFSNFKERLNKGTLASINSETFISTGLKAEILEKDIQKAIDNSLLNYYAFDPNEDVTIELEDSLGTWQRINLTRKDNMFTETFQSDQYSIEAILNSFVEVSLIDNDRVFSSENSYRFKELNFNDVNGKVRQVNTMNVKINSNTIGASKNDKVFLQLGNGSIINLYREDNYFQSQIVLSDNGYSANQINAASVILNKNGDFINEYNGIDMVVIPSDGGQIFVEVTSIKSIEAIQDRIKFELSDQNALSNKSLSCYQNKPIYTSLTYEPMAELQIKFQQDENSPDFFNGEKNHLIANGEDQLTVTTALLGKGGMPILDFDGIVEFSSAKGGTFLNKVVQVKDGKAETVLRSVNSLESIVDTINVKLIPNDRSTVNPEIYPLLQQVHQKKVVYQPVIQKLDDCDDFVNVAVVVDSSGSMKKNDPERLRVERSQALIRGLTPDEEQSMAFKFNRTAQWLKGPSHQHLIVADSLEKVNSVGGTNIGAGLSKAISMFPQGTINKNIVVLITDGKSSEKNVIQASKDAKQKGIRIMTVGLGEKKHLNEGLLKQVAQETGGQYYHAKENIELGKVYDQIFSSISCKTLGGLCGSGEDSFDEATAKLTADKFIVDAIISENCLTNVGKVKMKFKSNDGDVLYELTHRGHGYYQVVKYRHEIRNLQLMNEVTLLLFDKNGIEIGSKIIQID